MSATLTGSATGVEFTSQTLTISQSSSYNGTISFASNLAGTFAPDQHQWFNTSTTKTVLFTPEVSGSFSITTTPSISGSPLTITVSKNAATSFIFTGPDFSNQGDVSAQVGVATSNFTITPNGLATGTVVLSDGNKGGTFTPSSPLTFSNSSTPQTFTYTPAFPGKISISAIASFSQSPAVPTIHLSVANPAATTATLTGPASLTVQSGRSTGAFQVSLNGAYTGHVALSDSAAGGTFFPASIFFHSSNAPQLFYYTPAPSTSPTSPASISIVASPSLTLSGSPVSLTITKSTPFSNFGPNVSNPFYT